MIVERTILATHNFHHIFEHDIWAHNGRLPKVATAGLGAASIVVVYIATHDHTTASKVGRRLPKFGKRRALTDIEPEVGIRDEHIDRVAESLLLTGLTEIDRSTFEYHCHKCGIDPDNFTQADLDRLQEKLNE